MASFPNQPVFRTFDKIVTEIQPWTVKPVGGYGPGDAGHAKIILLGLDGATWKILTPLLENGLMPNLARLLQRASYGWMATDVAMSPVSWTSVATGKAKEQALRSSDFNSPWEYDYRVVRARRLWDILAPPPGDGLALIDYYYPPGRAQYPRALLVNHRSAEKWRRIVLDRFRSRRYASLCALLSGNATSVAAGVLERNYFHSLFSIEKGIDEIQHTALFFALWKELRKTRDASSVARAYLDRADKLIALYRRNDELIGRLLAHHANDFIVIVSDHGFHAGAPRVHVDAAEILRAGITLGGRDNSDPDFRFVGNYSEGQFAVHRTRVGWAFDLFRDTERGAMAALQIEFEEYRFTAQGSGAINAAARLCDFLRAAVKKERLPIVIERHDAEVEIRASTGIVDYVIRSMSYQFSNHNRDDPGILIVAGPGVAQGLLIQNASLFDVTPTLLYLKGLPVGADMRGRVLEAIINPALLVSRPIATIATYDSNQAANTAAAPKIKLTDEERRRLRDLGYLPDI